MTQVERLSQVTATDFPGIWYEIASENHFWFDWRFRAFLQQLRTLKIDLQTPYKVLEIGCGHGIVRRQMECQSNWIVDGADVNLEALQQNNTTRGRTLLYDIFDRKAELQESYDFVILFDVIEHIQDVDSFLRAVLSHLKPNGILFINVPALEKIRTKFDDVVGHLRRYDKEMMHQTIAPLPLKTIDIRYWGFSSIALILLRKLFTPSNATEEEMVRAGLKPPGDIANTILRWLAAIETKLINSPPIGTSLLVATIKEEII